MTKHDWFTDPLAPLFNAHRRVERRLAELAALPVHLELHGMTVACCAAAAGVVHTVDQAVHASAAEEGGGLLRLLAQRLQGTPDHAAFEALRRQLARDHREIADGWRDLRRPLRAIMEGVARPLDPGAIAAFRALHGTHVAMEEAPLHRLAVRYLWRPEVARLTRRAPVRRVSALVGSARASRTAR